MVNNKNFEALIILYNFATPKIKQDGLLLAARREESPGNTGRYTS